MRMWVDKVSKLPVKIEFYDEQGRKARTQLRTGLKLDEGSTTHYSPLLITFIDHRRGDHKTELKNNKPLANTNLADDVFSQRSLLRGR